MNIDKLKKKEERLESELAKLSALTDELEDQLELELEASFESDASAKSFEVKKVRLKRTQERHDEAIKALKKTRLRIKEIDAELAEKERQKRISFAQNVAGDLSSLLDEFCAETRRLGKLDEIIEEKKNELRRACFNAGISSVSTSLLNGGSTLNTAKWIVMADAPNLAHRLGFVRPIGLARSHRGLVDKLRSTDIDGWRSLTPDSVLRSEKHRQEQSQASSKFEAN